MRQYDKPLPKIDELNAPYWEGARAGELRLQTCGHCGRISADPARLCMSCGSPELSWVAASGRARLWSFGIFHKAYFPSFASDVPYNVAIVELEEGPRLYSNIVAASNDELKIGMPLKVHFEPVTEAVTLVKFVPAPDGPPASAE